MFTPDQLKTLIAPLVSGVCDETKDHAERVTMEFGLHLSECDECRNAILQTHEQLPFLFKQMISSDSLENYLQQFIERCREWERQRSQKLLTTQLSSSADATMSTQSQLTQKEKQP